MSEGSPLRLILAVVFALAVLTALVVLGSRKIHLGTVVAARLSPAQPAPVVRLIALDGSARQSRLAEQASLLLLEPLFLPTAYNTSQPELPAAFRREPGANFPEIASRFIFTDDAVDLAFPDSTKTVDQPAAALRFGRTSNPYVTLGRRDQNDLPLSARQASLEVVHIGTGRTVLSVPLSLTTSLPKGWEPMELVASVDAAGLVGAPAVVKSSGVDGVDEILRAFLANGFRLGEKLAPGFYALRIGP